MHQRINLPSKVSLKAYRLWRGDRKLFWRFIKEHGRCADNELLFEFVAGYLEAEKNIVKHIFRLALYTDLSYLLDVKQYWVTQDHLIPNDKKVARFLRRKLRSHQCRNHLLQIRKPAHPFELKFMIHRALLKALIKYGHDDFVFKELQPYSDYIKGSPTASLLVMQRLYRGAKQVKTADRGLEEIEACQESIKQMFSIIDLHSVSNNARLDIFRGVMADDKTVIPKFVAQEPTFYPQSILNLYLRIILKWLDTDSSLFETFENPSYTFTRFLIFSQLSSDSRALDKIAKIKQDLFDFVHVKHVDTVLVWDLIEMPSSKLTFGKHRQNFIKHAEPAVFERLSSKMSLTINDLAMMNIGRAYELMENGALVNIKIERPNTKFPEWLSPFPGDSDMVRLTKQHMLRRPNLRLLHKVLIDDQRNSQYTDIVEECKKDLRRRFKKYRFWGKTDEPVSLVLLHMGSLQGYTSDLVDYPRDCISFLQDYLLVPFRDVRFDKNPSVLDMPLHLFELNEELIPLLLESMKTTPLTPKLETIMDMCQYHVDFSLTQMEL